VATGENRVLAGRYRLLSLIGSGGMGTVWRARDELLDRDVAIKEVKLRTDLTDHERAVLKERTKREARATARLNHPGIITVHDVVEEDGRPCIVMEYVAAASLQEILEQDGPLPVAEVAEIGRQILSALRAAHAAGILHRDVKPANVLLLREGRETRAVLTDFGLAQTAGDVTLTQTGLVMGSPAYIAPERARGEKAGPPADLWAFGATLYAAVEGRPPHDRSEVMAALAAVLYEDPPVPRNAGPLTALLMALLDRDASRRPTMEAAADHLATLTGLPPPWAPGAVVPAPADGRTRSAPAGEPSLGAAAPIGDLAGYTGGDPAGYQGGAGAAGYTGGAGAAGATRAAARAVDAETAGTPGGQAHQLGIEGAPAEAGTQAMAGRRRRRRLIWGGVALAGMAVAGLVTAHMLNSSLSTGVRGNSPTPSTGRQVAPQQENQPRGVPPLPVGWKIATGTGYTIYVPGGWKRVIDGENIFWLDPKSDAYVQVDRTPWETSDPSAHWRIFLQSVRTSGHLKGFQQTAQVRQVTGEPYKAADVEYTYNPRPGTVLHVQDRSVLTQDGQEFAVLAAYPAKVWAARSAAAGTILDSFQPQ